VCIQRKNYWKIKEPNSSCGTEKLYVSEKHKLDPGDPNLINHEWCSKKARINGTLAHTTAIFGFTLAGLVMQDIYKKDEE